MENIFSASRSERMVSQWQVTTLLSSDLSSRLSFASGFLKSEKVGSSSVARLILSRTGSGFSGLLEPPAPIVNPLVICRGSAACGYGSRATTGRPAFVQ